MVKTLTPKKAVPPPTAQQINAALAVIKTMEAPEGLRRMMANARLKGVEAVHDAALARLVDILPGEQPGPFEHEAWKSIHLLEELETRDRGKTIRLSRTRQKITRQGIQQAMADLAGDPKPRDGFSMLVERGLADLTFEAIVLKHAAHFEASVRDAARDKLNEAGIDATPFDTSKE